ncbi:hypothetical protein A2164_01695 [Candidatus Curtissbacteria bacterium RBG_13_35_7]|uniref:Exosortase/archaeosortase family protein n=1 Tax=Candidatus Curtissbacteria bacterium RBG_13_35_7 TaxID=1797705 RepID=A0A1F5G085_9BACT|nr:MAG: hypothetical protein A2164_01695 [Candidatus Curtissbacteria bacterium RBG_13_35_7]
MRQSKFSTIFVVSALLLLMLPFISTFNEFLTSIFLRWRLYQALENVVVPYEAKVLAGIFNSLNIAALATQTGIWISQTFIEIQWNCLGWQSAVLLLATFLTGFQGNFTKSSKFEVIFIGVVGTYLITLARMLVVGIFAVMWNVEAVRVFHDWFSLIFVIAWFFVFWWFSYSFVLETKDTDWTD